MRASSALIERDVQVIIASSQHDGAKSLCLIHRAVQIVVRMIRHLKANAS